MVELIKFAIERFARADFGNASAAALQVKIGGGYTGGNFLDALRMRVVKRDDAPALPDPAVDAEYSIEDERV